MDGAPIRQEAYIAYMLRLWQAGSREGTPVWRASLENPHTGERLAFGEVQTLFAFLSDLLASVTETRGSPEAVSPVGASHSTGLDVAGENLVE